MNIIKCLFYALLFILVITSCTSPKIYLNDKRFNKTKLLKIDCSKKAPDFNLSLSNLGHRKFRVCLLRELEYIIKSPVYNNIQELKKDKKILRNIHLAAHSGEALYIEIINPKDSTKNEYYYKPISLKGANCH